MLGGWGTGPALVVVSLAVACGNKTDPPSATAAGLESDSAVDAAVHASPAVDAPGGVFGIDLAPGSYLLCLGQMMPGEPCAAFSLVPDQIERIDLVVMATGESAAMLEWTGSGMTTPCLTAGNTAQCGEKESDGGYSPTCIPGPNPNLGTSGMM